MSSSESEGSSSSAGPWAVAGVFKSIPARSPKTWVVCATCGWAELDRPDIYERKGFRTVILLCHWCFRVPAPPYSWGPDCNAEHFLRRMKLLPNCLQHFAVTYLIQTYLVRRDFFTNYIRGEGVWAESVFAVDPSTGPPHLYTGRLMVHPRTGELINPLPHMRFLL